MKLYVARHGQSETNHIGLVAGAQDDSGLAQQGWDDAALLAKNIGSFQGLIVSSPLHRALETAEYVRDQLLPGAPIRVDDSFVERDMGSATDRPRDEYEKMEKSDAAIAGAETPEQMFERVKRGLDAIRRTGQDTLLVTHDVTERMIYCVLNHKQPHEFAHLPTLKNGEYRVFEL